jgi:predicted PurR-regulated permease PerM
VFALVIVLMVPPLVSELGDLASRLPGYYDRLLSSISHTSAFNDQVISSLQQLVESAGSALASATGSLVSTLASIFGGFIQFVATFVIAFYLVVQENGLRRFIHSITPRSYQPRVDAAMGKIQEKLGAWLRGQLLLMLIIGVLVYVGLELLGMDYALVLGLWAGLTEIIPYVGPILGAIPGIFLALSMSPMDALWVGMLYLVAQQLENNLIVPMVMKRAVGLNPVISIVAVLVGARLGGVVGALMAIPLATAIAVIVSDLFESRGSSEPPFGAVS